MAQHAPGRDALHTTEGTFVAHHLAVASGIQNVPWVPEVDRVSSAVTEVHSSHLRRSQDLAGRWVTVVGGGASAWDLLDLATEHGASQTST